VPGALLTGQFPTCIYRISAAITTSKWQSGSSCSTTQWMTLISGCFALGYFCCTVNDVGLRVIYV